MFDYHPGNHGLTEEIVYEQQPTSTDDAVPIFSGSADNRAPIGHIRRGAVNNKGEALDYFEGPCLILTKDGSAGQLTYKPAGVTFTINHHACVLTPKPEWRDRLHLPWFAHQFRKHFLQVVTSRSDNMVFSTEWFDRLKFAIPPRPTQEVEWAAREPLVRLQERLQDTESQRDDLLTRPIRP